MKNWILSHKKAATAGTCVLAALFIAVGIFFYQKNTIAAAQAAAATASADQTAGKINAWGEVKYTHMEDISIDFPALVTDIPVKEGDRVTLGQPLVTLDLSEYNGNIEKLKQQLAVNQAALPTAEQDISALQADIAQIQSEISRKTREYNDGTNADLKLLQDSLDLTKKQLATAETDLQNYQSLYDAGAIPKATLDQYADALDQRRKAVSDVQNNIQKAKTALKDELDKLNILLKSKQAQLSQLKLGNTANTTKQQGGISSAQVDLDVMAAKTSKDYINGNQIVSNIKNGIVQNIMVSNAAHLGVQGAPTGVLQIIDADSIVISAEVYEEYIGSVKIGKTVKIVPASAPDILLTGTVTQIPDLAVEKNGRRVIRVLVKPDDPNYLLKPGYTADIYFEK